MITAKVYRPIVLLCFIVFSSLRIWAQPDFDDELDPRRREKMDVLKRSFITDKIQLTVSEAEKFWPLYNEREVAQEANRKAIRERMTEAKKNPGDQRMLIAGIDFVTAKRKEDADLDAKFLKAAIPIIGAERCMKLASADREFQRELIKKLKDGRDGKGDGGKKNHH